jgi:hypothetical protein
MPKYSILHFIPVRVSAHPYPYFLIAGAVDQCLNINTPVNSRFIDNRLKRMFHYVLDVKWLHATYLCMQPLFVIS